MSDKVKISIRIDKEIVRQIKEKGNLSDIIRAILSDKYGIKPNLSDKSKGKSPELSDNIKTDICLHFQSGNNWCWEYRIICPVEGRKKECPKA